MEKTGQIEFRCIEKGCEGLISLSILDIENNTKVFCPECKNEYTFNKDLTAKIKKFVNLIYTVRDSEDILGNTNIAIDLKGHEVKIPYRLLLTRLNTLLSLKIGDKIISFKFRVEPLKES